MTLVALVLCTALTTRVLAHQNNPLDNLSSSEKNRFREILQMVIQNEEIPTRALHQEFWTLFDKIGKLSPTEIEYIREVMTGAITTYMKYLYEDASWALRTKRPFKSPQREEYEKKLLRLGAMTEWRIKANEEFVAKIASGKPIQFEGNDVILDENMIQRILSDLNAAAVRAERLFSRVYKPDSKHSTR